MAKLTWTAKGETRTVEVTESCSIGRLETSTVPLPDETGASRRHCQILKIPSGFELSDLGSTNGTKVNGQTVKRHKLADGDEIRIGETVLRWSDGSGKPAAKPAEDEVVLEGDVALEEPAGAPAGRPAASGGGTSEQCVLVFAGGAKDGQKIVLERRRVTFGRNPKNTNVIPDDAGVSGYHCEVCREGGAYVLRDLGSTNGTFVDGEQVTELALQHGNRIRIGQTRLVFVDPTVSDFEKAMSSVEDLGSEWGMLRAEMDMTRVQQARRSQMVAIGGLAVVLAGAGYVAVAHPEMISGREKEPTKDRSNIFPGDFSFESGAGDWAALPGSPAQGRFGTASDGAAFEGKSFYTVARDGAAGRAAAVACGEKDRIAIDPNAAYAFGAKVRTKGDAQACVRVAWLDLNGRPVGSNASDLMASDAWTDARGAVARPPRGANTARLELVNAGGGSAHFDNVFFAPAEPKPSAPEAKSGELSVSLTPDGQATVRRGNQTLLADAAVVAGALRADAADGRTADRVASRRGVAVSPAAGGSARVQGQAYEAVGGKWQPFSADWTSDGRYVGLDAELAEDAAIVATLSKDSVDEGLGVRTEGSYFRLTEARTVEKVRSVSFGERNVFEAAAEGDAPSWRFTLARAADGQWTVAIGAAGGKLKLKIDTDSAEIRRRTDDLAQKAKDAKLGRRMGAAIALFRELGAKLPQGTPQAADAAREADTLEAAGRAEAARISEGRVAATDFKDLAELAALEARAAALAAQYEGHEAGAQAAADAAAMREAVAKRTLEIHEDRAAPMLARADDYAEHEDHVVAAAIYRGIIGAYPGTGAAKRAKDALDKLPAGK